MTGRSIHGDGGEACGQGTGRRAVLLVDSARDNRAMYAEFLGARGFHPIEIDNTADALALAVTADAVVTGIRVAGPFDGLQLVRCLRADEQTRSKPVVVLTACAFHEDERRAREAGCDVFLAKPCLPAMLAAELRRVLAMRLPRARPLRATRTRASRDIA